MLISPMALPQRSTGANESLQHCVATTGVVLRGMSVKNYSSRPFTADKSSGADSCISEVRMLTFQRDDDAHPDLRKTRMCPNFSSLARCPLSSDKCRFAHSNEELRVSYDRFYKVQPCAFFDRGKCRNGEYCRFAHGRHELRIAAAGGEAVVLEKNPSSLVVSNGLTDQCYLTSPTKVSGSRPFDLASFLSTQQQRYKRQSYVNFVSRHSRRRSDGTGGQLSSSGLETMGEDEGLLKSDLATCSGISPDGSPLGGRSTGMSSHDAWSDCSPVTHFSSSENSPARYSATSSSPPAWERTKSPSVHVGTDLLSAIQASLTSCYTD